MLPLFAGRGISRRQTVTYITISRNQSAGEENGRITIMKIVSRFLVFAACLGCLSVPLFAQGGQIAGPRADIAPMSVYISSTANSLSISGGTATCNASIRATSQIGKCEIISKLQRYQNGSWTTLKTFTETASTYYASQSETYSVSRGYSYRLVTSFYVYRNGIVVESAQKTSSYDYL